jgi:metal-responsive CopG/Arc/MetJ family transcriptional regulator
MNAKMGRPTDNPKPERISVRLDEECIEVLNQYCEETKVTRVEAVRQGIKKLKPDIKK